MPFAPATHDDITAMLATVGATSIDELFNEIPEELRFRQELAMPLGISEAELVAEATALAGRNVDMSRELTFLGYGCYDHFVPTICDAITSRSEFATAYTPYQPEISQGTLQAIFEFQTAICELTGLGASNASLYDGATATVEAMYMCGQASRRQRVIVLRTVAEQTRAVLRTYARAYGIQLDEVAFDPATGTVPVDVIRDAITGDTACVIVQQPNAFGCYEDAPGIVEAARASDVECVVNCDPLSLGVLEAPGVYGAGIAVGDGQPLGLHASFGGPAFGFMAVDRRYVRRMPGRIVGQSVDSANRRAYVLTLQTREQHIRREKATSNICSNQALCALAGTIYLAWLGPQGLRRLGTLLVDRSMRLRERVTSIPGVREVFAGPTFKEAVIRLPRPARDVIAECKRHGVHPGFAVGRDWPELGDDALLMAVTEKRTDADIERLVDVLGEVLA